MMKSEPRTEAGRALRGYILAGGTNPGALINGVAAAEGQAAAGRFAENVSCASCSAGRGCAKHPVEQEAAALLPEPTRLDFRDELTETEHEVAEFLHRLLWGPTSTHDTEPGDGSDCHECYAQAELLFNEMEAAADRLSEPKP